LKPVYILKLTQLGVQYEDSRDPQSNDCNAL